MLTKKEAAIILLSALVAGFLWIPGTVFVTSKWQPAAEFVSPFVADTGTKEMPLEKYGLDRLHSYPYTASPLTIDKKMTEGDGFVAYQFHYTTMGKKMSGMATVPKNQASGKPLPAIIMLRGYVEPSIYTTGVGTKNAAAQFAKSGYVTLAPDFFGYGESASEPEDSWEARFIKPIIVIELLKSVQQSQPVFFEVEPSFANDKASEPAKNVTIDPTRIGMWGHSNGGQIALSTLEVLSEPIPTTLWAPVTAPFPYSILFFSDETEDEGKGMRLWVSQFEKDYDVFTFSITKHLDKLSGPLQIHHGTSDDAALIAWSTEFMQKIEAENKKRLEEEKATATMSAESSPRVKLTKPIEVEFHTYAGADHNLQPGWNTVIERDLTFFAKHLQ